MATNWIIGQFSASVRLGTIIMVSILIFLEEATNPIIQYINRTYVPEMLISTDQGETDNKHDCQMPNGLQLKLHILWKIFLGFNANVEGI